MMRFFAILVLSVIVGGCGYHTPGAEDAWLGGDSRIVYVDLFDNRTAEPYLENFLVDALVEELSKSRVIELTEDSETAELRLVGSILDFKSSALAYGSDDTITDYRATMKVDSRLMGTDSRTLWKSTLSRSEEYLAAVNKNLQLEGERLAAREVSKRLAEDIYSQLLQDF